MKGKSLIAPFLPLVHTGAVLGCLLAFFYLFENWRGQRSWNRLAQELEAEGERLDWTAFRPGTVADADNFMAATLLEGIAYKDKTDPTVLRRLESNPLYSYSFDTSRWKSRRWVDLGACGRLLHSDASGQGSSGRTESAAAILRALASLEPDLRELRQASQRPFAQFRGGSTPDDRLPNVAPLRSLAYLLGLRASAELALGQTAEARADIKVLERLAAALAGQPSLVASMCGGAIRGGIVMQTFWEGWAAEQWTDEQLVQFQNDFDQTDLLASYDRSMRGGERAGLDFTLRHQPATILADLFGTSGSPGGFPQFAERLYFACWPKGWLYQNQVFHHRLLARTALSSYSLTEQRVFPAKLAQATQDLSAALGGWNPFAHLAAVGIPNFPRATKAVAAIQTSLQQAALVCALERYRRQHGSYPDSLRQLVPDFIAKLPTDLMTGQPLHFRKQETNSFLLYGVGWDESDDNGRPEALSTGDWVWPSRP